MVRGTSRSGPPLKTKIRQSRGCQYAESIGRSIRSQLRGPVLNKVSSLAVDLRGTAGSLDVDRYGGFGLHLNMPEAGAYHV